MWRMLDTRGGTWVQLVKDNKEGNGGAESHIASLPGVNPEYFYAISRTMGQFRDCIYIVNENITFIPATIRK